MSVVNRSVFSFTLLAVGLSASLGSNCGELPLPISENEGPQFRLDGETEFVEFDVTVTADVSDLPLEVDRYSHALLDLVPGVDSDGLARVRVYDRWHQVLLDQEVAFTDGRAVQLTVPGVLNDCPVDGICEREFAVDVDRLSGEMDVRWYLIAEMEAGEVWVDHMEFDIVEAQ